MENTFGPTATDLKIKELANYVSTPKVRETNQFMIDVNKTLSDGTYTDRDEAIKGVLDYANSKNVSYKGIDYGTIIGQLAEKTPKEDKSIIDRFGETFKKRGDAGAGILTRGVAGDTGAIEGGLLFGANFLGTLASLTGDVIAETYTELAPEDFQKSVLESIQELSQTSGGEIVFGKLQEAQKNLEDLKRLDPVKGARFQGGLDVINGALTFAGGAGGKKAVEKGITSGTNVVKKTIPTITKGVGVVEKGIIKGAEKVFKPKGILDKLNLETVPGKIGDKIVDIPKQTKGVVEKLSKPFREVDTKVLAGRALSPRTVGKNSKQKLKSIADVDKNAKTFYENIRTGTLKGNIDTIEDAAQTVVTNIDTIGARIGNAVKKVKGYIDIDNNITDEIVNALGSIGADVSPATPTLKKFFDALGGGKLSISDAYELKKLFGNEVSKLYKAGDAGTKQYKALSDGVSFINTKIDDIIKTKLGKGFAKDKEIYGNLKTIVDDLVSSALVEGRRSPNTFAEQISMIEGILSPVSSIKQQFAKEIGNLNTRGGAWKELIKIYDNIAISNFTK